MKILNESAALKPQITQKGGIIKLVLRTLMRLDNLYYKGISRLASIDLPPEKESSFNVRLESKEGGKSWSGKRPAESVCPIPRRDIDDLVSLNKYRTALQSNSGKK